MSEPDVRTDLYHSRHHGRLGTYNALLRVAYCSWCAVGIEDAQDPRQRLQNHFEQAHPELNEGMWDDYNA